MSTVEVQAVLATGGGRRIREATVGRARAAGAAAKAQGA
jgi:hypothetical protein